MRFRPIAALPVLAAVCLALPAPAQHEFMDEPNMLDFPRPEAAFFDGVASLDLAAEGTVEVWVRHLWAPNSLEYTPSSSEMPPKAARDFMGYSVILALGDEKNLAFALVANNAGDGVTSGSKIGVLSSFDEVSAHPERFAQLSTTYVEGGKGQSTRTMPAVLGMGEMTQLVLVKERGNPGLKLYFNAVAAGGQIGSEFGATAGKSIRLGWDPGATEAATVGRNSTEARSQSKPFRGQIGGLRFYSRALSEKAVENLYALGPTADSMWLDRIDDTVDLSVYGDFRATHIDRSTGRSASRTPSLEFHDPLAGNWYGEFATTEPPPLSGALPGRMRDLAIYVLVPRHGAGAPMQQRSYTVFEDSTWIGTLERPAVASATEVNWTFAPCDAAQPSFALVQRVERLEAGRRRSVLECERLPKLQGAFAGRAADARLRLVRPTIRPGRLADVSPGSQDLISLQKERQEQQDMGMFFMFTNNVRYHELLWHGYDVSRMDGYDLFDRGLSSAALILRPATTRQFQIDPSNITLLPYNLRYKGRHAGETRKTSTVATNAQSRARSFTYRAGASVDMSASVTLKAAPLGAGMDTTFGISTSIGYQMEHAKEDVAANKTSATTLTTTSWFQKFNLFQCKELMELHPDFRAAVWTLSADVQRHPEDADKLVSAFYELWGTHYPFGMVYGAMGLWETVINSSEFENKLTTNFDTNNIIGQGRSGISLKKDGGIMQSLETASTVARSIGGTASLSPEPGGVDAGGESVPIFADLRPISELLCPQQFPDAPEIYLDLRQRLIANLPGYLLKRRDSMLDKLVEKVRAEGGSLKVNSGPIRGTVITVDDVERFRKDMNAPQLKESLQVELLRLGRNKGDYAFTMNNIGKLDGVGVIRMDWPGDSKQWEVKFEESGKPLSQALWIDRVFSEYSEILWHLNNPLTQNVTYTRPGAESWFFEHQVPPGGGVRLRFIGASLTNFLGNPCETWEVPLGEVGYAWTELGAALSLVDPNRPACAGNQGVAYHWDMPPQMVGRGITAKQLPFWHQTRERTRIANLPQGWVAAAGADTLRVQLRVRRLPDLRTLLAGSTSKKFGSLEMLASDFDAGAPRFARTNMAPPREAVARRDEHSAAATLQVAKPEFVSAVRCEESSFAGDGLRFLQGDPRVDDLGDGRVRATWKAAPKPPEWNRPSPDVAKFLRRELMEAQRGGDSTRVAELEALLEGPKDPAGKLEFVNAGGDEFYVRDGDRLLSFLRASDGRVWAVWSRTVGVKARVSATGVEATIDGSTLHLGWASRTGSGSPGASEDAWAAWLGEPVLQLKIEKPTPLF